MDATLKEHEVVPVGGQEDRRKFAGVLGLPLRGMLSSIPASMWSESS